MARVIVGSYLVQFPMGGYMSWVLQWLLGLRDLGHEVYFVEKANWQDACFDPQKNLISDDCAYGIAAIGVLFERFGFRDHWYFIDYAGNHYGMSRSQIQSIFRTTDLFIDMGSHGRLLGELSASTKTVLIDGEPGYTQMKRVTGSRRGEVLSEYDAHYTVGLNVGSESCQVPTGGIRWRAVFDPVFVDLFVPSTPPEDAPYTTVMSWQAHEPLTYEGRLYGQKNMEFVKFLRLPLRVNRPMEIAVAGNSIPKERLETGGWRLQDAHKRSITLDAFYDYIRDSQGEFSVCKHVFVTTRSGWLSDRTAIYLATGRPVVMQDTGFSEYLPCSEGLFAVDNINEAEDAINAIDGDWMRHSLAARELSEEYLSTRVVLSKLLNEL